jgi:hypothetical protein
MEKIVPSSTSSFEIEVPNGSWGKTLILAVVLAVSFLAGLDIYYRHAGHRPCVVDDKKLWCLLRDQIYAGNPKTVVLVGDSRIQLDFSTDYFRKHFPEYNVVQLAIDGHGNVLATLQDLADDRNFTGIVLCSLNMTFLMISEEQKAYVDYYHDEWTIDKKINRSIATFLQENAVIFNPNVGLTNFINQRVRLNQLPPPLYVITRQDRSRMADYTLTDALQFRRARLQIEKQLIATAKLLPEQEFDARIDQMNQSVRKLKDRGCQVVFVQFPSTLESWQLDEENFPKHKYWDRFAAMTPALTLHFQDVPALQGFECPDTSHLDYRDAPRFTQGLLNELVSRGVFNGQGLLASN